MHPYGELPAVHRRRRNRLRQAHGRRMGLSRLPRRVFLPQLSFHCSSRSGTGTLQMALGAVVPL
jgi:hypothetical protein